MPSKCRQNLYKHYAVEMPPKLVCPLCRRNAAKTSLSIMPSKCRQSKFVHYAVEMPSKPVQLLCRRNAAKTCTIIMPSKRRQNCNAINVLCIFPAVGLVKSSYGDERDATNKADEEQTVVAVTDSATNAIGMYQYVHSTDLSCFKI